MTLRDRETVAEVYPGRRRAPVWRDMSVPLVESEGTVAMSTQRSEHSGPRRLLDRISPASVEAAAPGTSDGAGLVAALVMGALTAVGALIGTPFDRADDGATVGALVGMGLLAPWIIWVIAFYLRKGWRTLRARSRPALPSTVDHQNRQPSRRDPSDA
ncbi:hypothetical protein [Parafrankia sp. FMc2]|uniref:hypothetical protein n=1 Tax=Parafrankia sp. FMc2 TaxID=3233196 RepID=UPI0034D4782B